MARPPQLGGFLDAEVDGLPLSTAEEPEEPVEEVVTPHDFVVLTESGDPDLEYQYGSIATAGGDETVALIAIASLENRLLVAVPESAWHRNTARRKLPARALSRPNLVAVAGCKIGTRTEEAHIVVQIKVWTGFLDPRLERELDFTSQTTPTWRFGELEDEELVPYAPALIEMAQENYTFLTAESQAQVPRDRPKANSETRLDQLENTLHQLKDTIDSLVIRHPNPKPAPAPKVTKSSPAKTIAGLDEPTVQAALAAGIPMNHLEEMGSILKQKPKRLEDLPRQSGTKPKDPLDESDPEEEEAEDPTSSRRWYCRCPRRSGSEAAHQDCQEADGAEGEEGLVGQRTGRRVWCSQQFLRDFRFRSPTKRSCSSSFAEEPHRETHLGIPSHRSQSPERLPSSPHLPRRTIWRWHHYPRLACEPLPTPAVREPCALELAGLWHLGQPHSQQTRGSQSPLCSIDCCQRPVLHRRRELAASQFPAARTSTAIPRVFPAPASHSAGATTYSSGRSEMDRSPVGTSQGGRGLHRIKEEARWKGSTDEDQGRGGSSSKGEGEGKVQSGAREGQEERGRSWGGKHQHHWQLGEEKAAGVVASTGPPPLDNHSQSEFIKVPGATASTFSGRAVIQSLFRSLRRGRCRLSGYARSFAALRFDHWIPRGTSTQEMFPIPLPYPEIFEAGKRMRTEVEIRKKGVTAVLIVLNYLHRDRPREAREVDFGSARPTRKQWEAIRRLEHLLEAWNVVSLVGPEEMGRTAGKVETLEATLRSLESRAAAMQKAENSYLVEKDRKEAPGDLRLQRGKVQGLCGAEGMTTFKPIDPSRLSFISRPAFDPSPYLDPKGKEVYNDPLKTRMPPEEFAGVRPHLRVHATASNKVKLFELLDSSGRLGVHMKSEITEDFGSGMFAITKDLVKDRLILDSRGANLLETPAQRWIKTLASAEVLTKLQLPDHHVLLSSGNDLRDFYYLFAATESRSRRNVLVGEVNPKSLSHLHAIKQHHLRASGVFCSMATLAMGDCQAVELAQTCHMGLALQHSIISKANCLAMTLPPPRTPTMVGILIDDFVALSMVHENKESEVSHGAQLSDQMQNVYTDVKLVPNTKKAFRDDVISTYWGADVDGRAGIVRGSLRRAIPLAGLLLEVSKLGVATADLLQVLVGSVISLFLFRRRFLAVLDPIFQSYRGRPRRAVIWLDTTTRETFLIIVALLLVAATNIRAVPNPWLAASDASNWGEAGVICPVPNRAYQELLRHCLRKSLWVKLLTPGAAWERMHGRLEPSGEIPSEEEPYKCNPLWTILATCLDFNLLFSKAKSGQRHINIGELRGALKTERLLGARQPSSRLIIALDSQVSLGTLIKGRASSPALNRELVRSIPHMLAYDIYTEAVYFETSINPADDGTRGKFSRPRTADPPRWWSRFCEGKFAEFDRWMEDHGLAPEELAGLPPFDELLPEKSVGRENGAFSEEEFVSSTFGHFGQSQVGESSGGDKAPFLGPEIVEKKFEKKRDEEESRESEENFPARSSLTGRARALLRSFPESQFVFPPGAERRFNRKGCLDLFSGERGVAMTLAQEFGLWSLCFDIEHSEDEDLTDPALIQKLKDCIAAGCFEIGGGGPVCASFSTAVTPPVRSSAFPYGKPQVSARMREKLELGNKMALTTFMLLELMLACSMQVWLENPATSWLFRLPEWIALQKKWPALLFWTVDYCRHKMKWRKRTKFALTADLGGQKELCLGGHTHQLLRGRSAEHRTSWTRVAQPYPKGVCRALARSLYRAAFLFQVPPSPPNRQRLDHASCARCTHARIGEATNPGPRRSHAPRLGALYDVPLVEPKTKALQTKVWRDFESWLLTLLTPGAHSSAMACPALLAQLLEEYGNVLYQRGAALYAYRHLVVVVQQSIPAIKAVSGPCWEMINKWEVIEPPDHRTPLPLSLFRAMMSTALIWRWERFASILGLAFYGIARPGEPLRETRSSLLLPSDLLETESTVAYLKIRTPKTRRRGGGRIQHLTVSDAPFVLFLERVFRTAPRDEMLFGGSPSSFRRRWDTVLRALGVGPGTGLTPGGIRGGGCVAAFQRGIDLPRILWLMRIRHLCTLENYLQEVSASSVVPDLPEFSRLRIKAAADMYPLILEAKARVI